MSRWPRSSRSCGRARAFDPVRTWLVAALALLLPLPASATSPPEVEPDLRAALIRAVNEADSFQDRFDAEVWLTDMSLRLEPKVADHDRRLELLRMVHYEASRASLPPELVLAVIEIESNFDKFAISRVGAQGLMQVMPFWLKEIGRPGDNLFNVRTNLRMGCTILRHYLDREKQDLVRGLSRYNGARNTRYAEKVLAALSRRWYRR